jgi:hypothetical protein
MPNTTGYWEKQFEKNKDKMLPENVESLDGFFNKMSACKTKERTIVNYYQTLIPFSIWCKLPFATILTMSHYR